MAKRKMRNRKLDEDGSYGKKKLKTIENFQEYEPN